ncbi:hypothetical protein Bhyg_15624 [Pseudolycoriella hygida]|uniref:Uncharacterized protein n=1 Tax=Pseudolycoriella hygida TaxID=35572 RepID=A0A9Q0MKG5_9DIPT|nr:hypothetical protein Bhyg_15624 [Pseudolycoriella hygida]
MVQSIAMLPERRINQADCPSCVCDPCHPVPLHPLPQCQCHCRNPTVPIQCN